MIPADPRIPATFLKHVTEDCEGCWIWTGALNNRGYSQFGYQGKTQSGHRLIYMWTRGPIEDDLTIDHLCRDKACVNPSHLEVVTRAENLRRAAPARTEHIDGLKVSRSAYKAGCRCRACSDANQVYQARRRAERSAAA